MADPIETTPVVIPDQSAADKIKTNLEVMFKSYSTYVVAILLFLVDNKEYVLSTFPWMGAAMPYVGFAVFAIAKLWPQQAPTNTVLKANGVEPVKGGN